MCIRKRLRIVLSRGSFFWKIGKTMKKIKNKTASSHKIYFRHCLKSKIAIRIFVKQLFSKKNSSGRVWMLSNTPLPWICHVSIVFWIPVRWSAKSISTEYDRNVTTENIWGRNVLLSRPYIEKQWHGFSDSVPSEFYPSIIC